MISNVIHHLHLDFILTFFKYWYKSENYEAKYMFKLDKIILRPSLDYNNKFRMVLLYETF